MQDIGGPQGILKLLYLSAYAYFSAYGELGFSL